MIRIFSVLLSSFLHLIQKSLMVNTLVFHHSATLKASLVFITVIAVQIAYSGGQDQCPAFSCGNLHNVSFPFRRPKDPPECGVPAYELICSSSKATIRINTGTYFVTNISYTDESFWVVDANLDMHSSYPLPRWDQLPYAYDGVSRSGSHSLFDLITETVSWACFVNCSQAITDSSLYKPVPCLTTNSSFVYVSTACAVLDLDPSCGLLLPALVVFAFLAHKYWKTRITIDAVEKFLQMQQMLGPIRFAYTDITAITSHFRDKLGQGGYGFVYKGVLLPGNVQVAVKMLGNSNCNGDEFISEVSTIGRIHHINVVRLVGFCAEEMRRALVYEYMPHGSLDKYIFSSDRSFSWDKLSNIALGIARGINYLHLGCDMQILHFDIKPHNILLDSNFVPKVADFGLAKLYPRDKSFVPSNALRRTIGYIAPEMVSRSFGVISSKSDVYSFGMLVLEMAGGRRNAVQNAENSSQAYYPSWVYDHLAKQEVGEMSAVADMHELERKLCIVGLRCIQMKPQDRPTMVEVIEMLEGGTDGMQMPSRPFFCDGDHMIAADSCHFSSESTEIFEEDE